MDRIKFSWIILITLTFSSYTNAQTSRTSLFNLENGLAIQGYDPVAYFTNGEAIAGKRELSTTYQDVTYYFSSAENKAAFIEDPRKFEPQYGGWCAYAMGTDGSKVKVDPETFKIIDGKLYLFYNFFFNNTLKSWNKEEEQLKSKADKNWSLLQKNDK